MKYLLIFLFSVSAQAKVCYLSYDKTDTQFVDCRIGPSPYKRICIGIEGERVASDYKVQILEPGIIFDTFRDWNKDAVMIPGESIVCSIDSDKKDERLEVEQAKKDAEKVKKDAKKDAWAAVCDSPKAGLETLICQERGY